MFSFKRFNEQFKINVIQNARKHGTYLLVIALFFIYLHYKCFNGGGWFSETPFAWAKFLIILMGIFHSIDVFGKLRRTDSGIQYLMMPASTTEKFAAAWLYSTIYTFVVYAIVFCTLHFISMSLGNQITEQDLPYKFPNLEEIKDTFFQLMFNQSIYFLGSILFRKNPFVKTTGLIIATFILVGMIGGYILETYFKDIIVDLKSHNINYDSKNMASINGIKLPIILEYYGNIIKTILYIIPFVCWYATYYKLKKLQI